MANLQIDLEKQYVKYKNVLKNADEGKVVTRFPPEASGYLHIGHIKAALLNFHYSRIYKGKVLMRFDDTNPEKEKHEYEQSILEDLQTIGFSWDGQRTYTSDYFQKLIDLATEMMSKDLLYCDNTEQKIMQEERLAKKESKCRNIPIEENLKIWKEMINGEHHEYCVRAKIDFQHQNGCMRDPVCFRHNTIPHVRTGNKFKIYPTYDFACPAVDSWEGVTHAMRSSEYVDRNMQYHWFQEKANLRKVNIFEFSRLAMVNTVFSKRKLAWFVDNNKVEGWHDPRFPTLRGIIRRGCTIEALTEFMLEQGPSKNIVTMDWDKLWAFNRKYIDNIAPRYTAISLNKASILYIKNGPQQIEASSILSFQKNPSLGEKILYKSKNILFEYDDAVLFAENEKITLMNWGNVQLSKKELLDDGRIRFEGEYLPEDKDFKNTKKITWLCADSDLYEINFVEYDHLLKVKKMEPDMKLEDVINEKTKFITEGIADPNVRKLQIGSIIQFERRGFFRLDQFSKNQKGKSTPEFIYIPDGKTTNMNKNIKTQLNANEMIGGKDSLKQAQQEQPLSKKQQKKLNEQKKKEMQQQNQGQNQN